MPYNILMKRYNGSTWDELYPKTDWANIIGKPTTFTPTSHTHTKSQITDFPTIPTVNNATLTIQKNATSVATFTANASSNVTANITVPTKTSDLTNDSGFLTSNSGVLSIATGSANGTISVNTNGTVADVAVKGLGSNAYSSTAYLPSSNFIGSNIVSTLGDNLVNKARHAEYLSMSSSPSTTAGEVSAVLNSGRTTFYNGTNALNLNSTTLYENGSALGSTYVKQNMAVSASGLAAGANPTISYNATTNTLTLGIPKGDQGIPGSTSGTASKLNITNNTTDTTRYPLYADAITGAVSAFGDDDFTYNPFKGELVIGGSVGGKLTIAPGTGSSIGGIKIGNNASTSADYALAIGQGAFAQYSYGISIGARSQSGGVGSIAVGARAKVSGVDYGIALGYYATANAGESIAIGSTASSSYATIASGAGSIAMGTLTDATKQQAVAIGYGAQATGTYAVALGPQANEANNKYITIGGSTAYVSSIGGYRAWTNRSDARDKFDIAPIPHAIDFINKLNPVTYVDNQREEYFPNKKDMTPKQKIEFDKWGMISDYDKEAYERGDKKGSRRRAGILAQEVYTALNETYGTNNFADIVNITSFDDAEQRPVEDKYLVTYTTFIPFLIKGIQEQQETINKLKTLLITKDIITQEEAEND